jgi:elongator complex protein 1
LTGQEELLEDVVYPAAFESKAQLLEDVMEMREQLRKQVSRLRELRVKKVEEPGMCAKFIPGNLS